MKVDLRSNAGTEPAASSPSISVLMAVRNGAPFLDEAIASLLSQSFTNFELIVVDNGSSDDTPAKLASWEARDARLRRFHVSRPGLARSLNHGATMARAPFLARLDADDVAEPDRLSRQYAAMTADSGIGATGTHAWIIDRHGRTLGDVRRPPGREAVRACLAANNPFIHSTVMMRRALFDQVGGYREGLRVTEDLDLWLRLAEICDLDLIPERLVRYRQHGASMMGRQPIRAILAGACVRAAVIARQDGTGEPFANGRPQLRRALPQLGIERIRYRKAIKEMMVRQAVERSYLALPLPWRFKRILRALLVRLGLKPVYARLLDWFQRARM